VIGQNMQRRPDLVQREVDEGHDVGGHSWTHPNIGETPLPQVQVELNATQRLFEVITGRSMRLFRPPFFGDAEPSTPHEVAPLVIAQTLGYMTVGLRIDPDDWQKPAPQEIIDRTLDRLDNPGNRPGQVVLLHDAGGDRSRTVAALPGLIDAIRARGYRLVTVGELAGMTPQQAMPPTSARRPSGWPWTAWASTFPLGPDGDGGPVPHRHLPGRGAAGVPGQPGPGPPLLDPRGARPISTRRTVRWSAC
jgi:hypothetical protein